MIKQISLDYIMNVLKETPNQRLIDETADYILSGEIELPYQNEMVKAGDNINTEAFIRQLNLISYRKSLVNELTQLFETMNQKFGDTSKILIRKIELIQASRPYSGFIKILAAEDITQSFHMKVSDCITLQNREEEIIKPLKTGETFTYHPSHYLKVVKKTEDLDGFSVAIESNKQHYGMRFANTSRITYCALPDFKNPKAQVKPDNDSEFYLVNTRFFDPGWVEFVIAPELFNSVEKCYIDTNINKNHFDIMFLDKTGTDIEILGYTNQLDGYIQEKKPANHPVTIRMKFLSLSETIVPIIKFIGLYKERYTDIVRSRYGTQITTEV